MFFKLEKNEDINNMNNADISTKYFNQNLFNEKNFNKTKSQIIENNNTYYTLKKKGDIDENNFNKSDKDSTTIDILSSNEVLEKNQNQNNNWTNHIDDGIQNQYKKMINNGVNNFYPKKKNNYNQNRQKFKKGKNKKNYKNYNINYNMSNLNMNEFMLNISPETMAYKDMNIQFPNNTINSDFTNMKNNNQINSNIFPNNSNIILGQNEYYLIQKNSNRNYNNQVIRNQNKINNFHKFNYNNQAQHFNMKNINNISNINNGNTNMNIINNNNIINNYISQRAGNYDLINKTPDRLIEPNTSKKLNNKFNINNSFDNINNFYNNINFNQNQSYQINNNYMKNKNNNFADIYNNNKHSIYSDYIINNNNSINNNSINNNNINNNSNTNNSIKTNNLEKINEEEPRNNKFKKMIIKIKLGENKLEKEINYNI